MPEGLKEKVKDAFTPDTTQTKEQADDAIWGPGNGPKSGGESKDGQAEDKIWGPGTGPTRVGGGESKDGAAEDKIWGSGPK